MPRSWGDWDDTEDKLRSCIDDLHKELRSVRGRLSAANAKLAKLVSTSTDIGSPKLPTLEECQSHLACQQ